MVTFTVLEEPELDESLAKFIGMSRVLAGIRHFDHRLAVEGDLLEALAGRVRAKTRRRNATVSRTAVKALRVAWQTELAARVGDQLQDSGLQRATLQTLPVQAYYAVFSAGRAFTELSGNPADKHAALHGMFESDHVRRAGGSWGVTLTGDPEDPSVCVLSPSICSPTSFNPMEIRTDDADYVWAALRMARRWRVARARKTWLESGANRTKRGERYKRLPPGQMKRIVERERATTMMDFLYELRCSTNYRTVDEYAVDAPDARVADYHAGLIHLMNLGLLLYETGAAILAGPTELQAIFDQWADGVGGIGPWAAQSGTARMAAIRAALA